MMQEIKKKKKKISIACSNCKKKKEEHIRNKFLSPNLFPANQKTQLVFLLGVGLDFGSELETLQPYPF